MLTEDLSSSLAEHHQDYCAGGDFVTAADRSSVMCLLAWWLQNPLSLLGKCCFWNGLCFKGDHPENIFSLTFLQLPCCDRGRGPRPQEASRSPPWTGGRKLVCVGAPASCRWARAPGSSAWPLSGHQRLPAALLGLGNPSSQCRDGQQSQGLNLSQLTSFLTLKKGVRLWLNPVDFLNFKCLNAYLEPFWFIHLLSPFPCLSSPDPATPSMVGA